MGEVEQVGAFGVVELEGTGDGVEHGGGDAADGSALELGVVLHADPGQGCHLDATQARDAAGADIGYVGLPGGDLGPPRGQELTDLDSVVHRSDRTGKKPRVGFPISTRLDRDSHSQPGRCLLIGRPWDLTISPAEAHFNSFEECSSPCVLP
jgi:hypothetical protein